jgi:hypothetical protein
VGLGVRHALFPDSLAFGAQLGSSILAGCQFPDATLSRTDLRIVFGPAAGPAARRFDFRGRLVERGFSASRLVHPSRDCLPTGPDPGCDSRFRPVSAGIGSSRLLGGYSSFPALRVLPLCSQVAFPFAGGRRCFQHPPHSDLIVLAPFSLPAGRALVGWTHSATWLVPLRAPVAKPGPLGGFSMVRYRRNQPSALAHSSNFRPGGRTVSAFTGGNPTCWA